MSSSAPTQGFIDLLHFRIASTDAQHGGDPRKELVVVLVGTKKAVAIVVNRTESQKRITTLRQRLVEENNLK